jgi:hypothetical protein
MRDSQSAPGKGTGERSRMRTSIVSDQGQGRRIQMNRYFCFWVTYRRMANEVGRPKRRMVLSLLSALPFAYPKRPPQQETASYRVLAIGAWPLLCLGTTPLSISRPCPTCHCCVCGANGSVPKALGACLSRAFLLATYSLECVFFFWYAYSYSTVLL